jgi:hypothetical protein
VQELSSIVKWRDGEEVKLKGYAVQSALALQC